MMRHAVLAALLAGCAFGLTRELTDWVVAPSVEISGCVCPGVRAIQQPAASDCLCLNNTYRFKAPNTLLGSFVQNHTTHPAVVDFDPMYGENINNISPTPFFKVPWWFNTTFERPEGTYHVLVFDGVNYRADVTLNGHQIATSQVFVGTFRRFAFDVSSFVVSGTNDLRVLVTPSVDHTFPPDSNSTDLSITFVDWNPVPPDRSMGLYQPVRLISRATPVDATGLSVETLVDPATGFFNASLSVVITQYAPLAAEGELMVELSCLTQTLVITIPKATTFPFESRVFLNASAFPALQSLSSNLLWNPWQLGKSTLHNLTIRASVAGSADEVLLQTKTAFRQVTSWIDTFGSRQFAVNQVPIQIRGAGWAPDMFLRADDTLLRHQFNMVRHMNLNAIRLEGKFQWDGFFDLADEFGLLILPGWCCCDSWQHWQYWGPQQFIIARESLRTQVRRLAHHPSVITFFYSSDQLPPAEVETMYLKVFQDEYWPNPTVSSASASPSNITGPSGVKMSGPYAWVPPGYWLQDSSEAFADLGGAWGFLTEGGPGSAPLTLSSWERTVPKDQQWSSAGLMSDAFDFHCANPMGMFWSMQYFVPPLQSRYINPTNVRSALYASQAQAFEGMRAMFEGYTKRKHLGATGLIQWMMNNAWPSNMWHLFDFYLGAGGGYYGAKRACEPLHLILSYADWSVTLVNSEFIPLTLNATRLLTATTSIHALNGTVLWSATVEIRDSIAADAVMELPQLAAPAYLNASMPADMVFARLELSLDAHRIVNDYWVSKQMDVLNWTSSTFYITEVSQYANFSALSGLGPSSVQISNETWARHAKGGVRYDAILTNAGPNVAFLVSLSFGVNGTIVTPALLDDSYLTLMPAEVRKVGAWLPRFESDVQYVSVDVETYNDAVV